MRGTNVPVPLPGSPLVILCAQCVLEGGHEKHEEAQKGTFVFVLFCAFCGQPIDSLPRVYGTDGENHTDCTGPSIPNRGGQRPNCSEIRRLQCSVVGPGAHSPFGESGSHKKHEEARKGTFVFRVFLCSLWPSQPSIDRTERSIRRRERTRRRFGEPVAAGFLT